MSKTIRLQVEKSRSLIKGLRKHLNEGGSGISSQQIASMEQTVAELLAVCDPNFAAVCTINSIKVVKYQQINAK